MANVAAAPRSSALNISRLQSLADAALAKVHQLIPVDYAADCVVLEDVMVWDWEFKTKVSPATQVVLVAVADVRHTEPFVRHALGAH